MAKTANSPRAQQGGRQVFRALPRVRVRTFLGQFEDHRLTNGQAHTLVDLDRVRSGSHPASISMRGQGWVMSDGKPVGSRDAAVWLRLVAMGLVEGSGGEVRLTTAGGAMVQSILTKSARRNGLADAQRPTPN